MNPLISFHGIARVQIGDVYFLEGTGNYREVTLHGEDGSRFAFRLYSSKPDGLLLPHEIKAGLEAVRDWLAKPEAD